MSRTTVVVLLCVAIFLPSSTASTVQTPTPPGPVIIAEDTYSLDIAAIREEFAASGRFSFRLPGAGEVSAEGVDSGTLSGLEIVTIDGATGEELSRRHNQDVPFEGTLASEPESLVRVLLGEWGLYGIVETNGLRYDLAPTAPGEQYVKVFALDEPTPIALPASARANADGLTQSTIAYYVDYTYQTTHPDYNSRVTSAFNQMDGSSMWQNWNIDMVLPTLYVVSGSNIVTSTDCGTAVTQFRDYMVTHLISGVTAYEIWSSLNFNGANAYGCASISDALQYADEWQTAVLEGTNHCCDLYDANSAYQRGIVSGHELAHIFGEENHPSGCATYWTHCNIMRQNVDNSARKFYFETSTGYEIQCRFYSNLEYGVNC